MKKKWNIGLWVVQVLLAAMFTMTGVMKLGAPYEELSKNVQLPEMLIRFIGAAELAGALGLILPSIFKIKPKLTPIAALCLVVVMILATLFHISKGEMTMAPVPFLLGILAGIVAWGRFKKAPIK